MPFQKMPCDRAGDHGPPSRSQFSGLSSLAVRRHLRLLRSQQTRWRRMGVSPVGGAETAGPDVVSRPEASAEVVRSLTPEPPGRRPLRPDTPYTQGRCWSPRPSPPRSHSASTGRNGAGSWRVSGRNRARLNVSTTAATRNSSAHEQGHRVAGDEAVLGHRALGTRFAMSVIRLIPLFVVLLVGQRYLVKGIATTGMK